MRQLNQAEAESFSNVQATEMARILDLQAQWENHRDDPTKNVMSLHDLRIRQKAFEAFQVSLRNYGEKYWNAQLPEMTQNTPERLAIWCRVLHAVFLRAEGVNPRHTLAKVYRLADRIALRLATEPVGRGSSNDSAGAAQELGAVIAWCDALVLPTQADKFKTALRTTG
jgi:hypothetical protein